MLQNPTDPPSAPAPEPLHITLGGTVKYVVLPLDYFLRLVDVAARAKYAPDPLPSTSPAVADRIAGALRAPGPPQPQEWQPQGLAREDTR